VKNQPILIILVYNILKKLDTGKYKCAQLTYKVLLHYLGKCRTVIVQLYSITISIKQLIFHSFPIVFIILKLNYGTLLAYVTVTVQSDLILTELQLHLFQTWTASSSALWMS